MSGPVRVTQQDLPIPVDVQPGKGWSAVMIAMADHIGAYDVLRLCAAYGGQQVYFPLDASKAPFADVLGTEKAVRLCRAFQREKITLPTGVHALAVARRGGVLASVKAGEMTIAEAAAALRIRRDTMSSLVKSFEVQDCATFTRVIDLGDGRQLDMFGDDIPAL